MAQLGRIGGHLLQDNLLREGIDLGFKNTNFDSNFLYLDVQNQQIGIRTETPVYDLDVQTNINTTVAQATYQAKIDNIVVEAVGRFSTTQGPIEIQPNNPKAEMYFEQMQSDDIYFNDNIIGGLNSSGPVALEANGTGKVDVITNTNIYGDLNVQGNLTIDGDLTTAGTVILGDHPMDVVVIQPDLTQDIVPGANNQHELGQEANDSTARKFASLHTPDLTNITTNRPSSARVSDQQYINGLTNEIFASQSDDHMFLSPDTGITFIEDLKFQNNDITNLNATDPLRFASTGIGYLRFTDTNAFLMPAGGDGARPAVPELGDMRWNSDRGILECFHGEIYNISISGVTTGLADQIQTGVTGTTNGTGELAQFRFTIVGGSLTVEVTQPGRGYNLNDTVVVSGTVFLGGTSPANDITITVGSQESGGYRVATGGGAEVRESFMEQLSVEYDLILG